MSYIKHRADESLEDYLETILLLYQKNGQVRSIDIATEMNFSKPSVSVAMKNLRNSECITMSREGYIHLTEKGQQIAESVYERHTLLSDWLIHLGVEPEIAKADACKMEHDISPESFKAIKDYVKNTL